MQLGRELEECLLQSETLERETTIGTGKGTSKKDTCAQGQQKDGNHGRQQDSSSQIHKKKYQKEGKSRETNRGTRIHTNKRVAARDMCVTHHNQGSSKREIVCTAVMESRPRTE